MSLTGSMAKKQNPLKGMYCACMAFLKTLWKERRASIINIFREVEI
jgi:hypothetical protein